MIDCVNGVLFFFFLAKKRKTRKNKDTTENWFIYKMRQRVSEQADVILIG